MGASHAIGHVLGGGCDLHYFCTAGVVPSALRYNQPAPPEAQKSIAGAQRAPDLDASDAFAGFIGAFGRPSRLSALGRRQAQSPCRKGRVFDIYLIHSGTHL
jgi:maleylacetate reductase